MFGQITSLIARNGINIGDMISKHKDKIGYTILNVEREISDEIVENIRAIEGVRMVRVINKTK